MWQSPLVQCMKTKMLPGFSVKSHTRPSWVVGDVVSAITLFVYCMQNWSSGHSWPLSSPDILEDVHAYLIFHSSFSGQTCTHPYVMEERKPSACRCPEPGTWVLSGKMTTPAIMKDLGKVHCFLYPIQYSCVVCHSSAVPWGTLTIV